MVIRNEWILWKASLVIIIFSALPIYCEQDFNNGNGNSQYVNVGGVDEVHLNFNVSLDNDKNKDYGFVPSFEMTFLISQLRESEVQAGGIAGRLSNGVTMSTIQCSELRMGQFKCNATWIIDPLTQQPRDCSPHNIATVQCTVVEGLICEETRSRTFTKIIPCKWTNGYSLSTTLLLSVFFGTLGVDRLYLGHIGMGILKMCTLGFLFVGQLVDIILIATEHLSPKDGSHYVTGFYGPSVQSLRANNLTYVVHRVDWFT